VGGLPGPFCNAKNTYCATTANCLIASYQQCTSFGASSANAQGAANWATDIYVLVRGKAHSEANVAMRFTFRVERDSSYDVRHMYYLEKNYLLPVAPTPPQSVAPVSCPLTNVPNASVCCPAASGMFPISRVDFSIVFVIYFISFLQFLQFGYILTPSILIIILLCFFSDCCIIVLDSQCSDQWLLDLASNHLLVPSGGCTVPE
jgi:hypothetical protein